MKRKLLAGLMAAVLVCTLLSSVFAVGPDAHGAAAAKALHTLSLFQGTGTTTAGEPIFDLDKAPSRAQAIVMLVRLLGKEHDARSSAFSHPFEDVPDWASPYVGFAYEKGYAKGVSDVRFGSDDAVSANAFLTFVLRALGYRSEMDFQWDKASVLSDAVGLTDGAYRSERTFTRGDVAAISLRALSLVPRGEEGDLLSRLVRDGVVDAALAAGISAPIRHIGDGDLVVYFLDVGQGDSILIRNGSSAALIDGGEVVSGSKIVAFLKSLGIESLDLLVATHPHADHIGGLPAVVRAFDIKEIFMPDVLTTTQTFENLLDVMDEKGYAIEAPEPGRTLALGDALLTVLGPLREYPDLNNSSLVLRLDYGTQSFLFAADMEKRAENDLLASRQDLRTTVLKLGHHGSDTSTGDAFLKEVAPAYAVASSGANNAYGHPSAVVLQRLKAANISLFRTDENGTIAAVCDGTEIWFRMIGSMEPKGEGYDGAYIGNQNSLKYHQETCSHLPTEKNRIFFDSPDEAEESGYEPCKICNPGGRMS